MKNHTKLFVFIIIIAVLTVAFNTSYTTVNIDNIATVVALGIDSDGDNNLKVSFQFTKPSSVSESGTSEPSSSIIKTVSASSISSAINLMNNYTGKEISLSHCKLIVFSEELAKKGITDEIYTLMNDMQVRPSSNIVISKCKAEYYIDNTKPLLEPLLAKYYEKFANSSQFTGYTSNATIGDFFDKMICHSCNPYAILGGINFELPKTDNNNSNDITSSVEAAGKSNYSTLSSSTTSENKGLAVFRDGIMVGELNAIETLAFMCISNDIKGFLISIPDPSVESGYLDVYLKPEKKTKINVSLTNGSPYVKVNCKFSGQIYSINKDVNYLDDKALSAVSKACDNYLKYVFTEYLYKTSKDLHSDINGIGTHALRLFLTSGEFEAYNWKNAYKDSFFDVSVSTSVKSSALLSES